MLVENRKQFDRVLQLLNDSHLAALDTETTGLRSFEDDEIAGISVFTQLETEQLGLCDFGYYLPFRHAPGDSLLDQSDNLPIEWLTELKGSLEAFDGEWIFHHARHDVIFLERDGIYLKQPYYDTLPLSSMWDEHADHHLEDLVDLIFGWNTKDQKKYIQNRARRLGGYDKIPPAEIEKYACQDGKSTFYLFEFLRNELRKEDQWKLWPKEKVFSDSLMQLHRVGLRIDRERCNELSNKAQKRMRELEDLIGFDPNNYNLARVLFKEQGYAPLELTMQTNADFPKGVPAVNKDALLALGSEKVPKPEGGVEVVSTVPLVMNVLEYRSLVKANSTWYEGFTKRADKNDRVHFSYNWVDDGDRRKKKDKYATVTGRVSGDSQQFPRDPEAGVRKCIIAADGFKLYSFDYSQIEFRLAAVYTEDELFLETFRSGGDLHQAIADQMGIGRHEGKTLNFSIIYQGGIRTVSYQLDITEDEARQVLQEFHSLHPNFRRFQKKLEGLARSRGYVQLWDGRRCHFKEEKHYHKAFNRLIQGGAAAIMKETMVRFHDDWTRNNENLWYMVGNLHDALSFEIKEEICEEMIPVVKSVMEWPSEDERFTVPFPVDVKEGY